MDYIGNKCPVCDKYFHADEDIVVCPECGTPHHRECYESLGHCCNEQLHKEGYDYNETAEAEQKEDIQKCPSCGKANDEQSFFCKYCGSPLSKQGFNSAKNTASPNDNGTYPYPFMDPMGGVASDTDFGDGVKAGEVAKYVKQNTPYFIRVFNNIASVNRSKFNFAAALFAGGYMLYRKMYKVGAFITAIQAAMMILSTFIRINYASVFNEFANQYTSLTSTSQLLEYYSRIASADMFILYLPTIIMMLQIGLMITVGCTFNRLYFKHCKTEVINIKSEAGDGINPETELQTKGGVNMPLAISLLVANMIVYYLPGVVQALF